jgi:hypothetical protein
MPTQARPAQLPAAPSRHSGQSTTGGTMGNRWYLQAKHPAIASRSVYRVPRCLVLCQPVSPAEALARRNGPCFGHVPCYAKGPLPGRKGP